jgi:hypothetical protein
LEIETKMEMEMRTWRCCRHTQHNATLQNLNLVSVMGLTRVLKRRGKAAILVDAAGHLSTSTLDLDSIQYKGVPDFIVCSFHKIYLRPYDLPINTEIT